MKPVRMLSITVVAAAALLTSVLATPAGAATPTDDTAGTAVSAVQCSLVNFDSAVVAPDNKTGKLTLTVTGVKPSSNVVVELVPVVYIQQPDYWIILVNGCASGIGLPVLTPYVATLDITSTIGTLGVEVVGANGQLKIPVWPVR